MQPKPEKCCWCNARPSCDTSEYLGFTCGTKWIHSPLQTGWVRSDFCSGQGSADKKIRIVRCQWCGTELLSRADSGVIMFACGTVASPPPDDPMTDLEHKFRWLIGPDCSPLTGDDRGGEAVKRQQCKWCGIGVDYQEDGIGPNGEAVEKRIYYGCDTTLYIPATGPVVWSRGHWCATTKERGIKPRLQKKEIDNRFTYHPPFGNQPSRYENIREQVKRLAQTMAALCPESRELSTALTHLDIAMMMANAAIARNERPPKENG